MSLFKKTKKTKACVIGLDGVPFSLIKDLTQKGVMPAFAQLIERGCLHKMKASLPEISSVSWTDFMIGTNSGTHGIFGFIHRDPQDLSKTLNPIAHQVSGEGAVTIGNHFQYLLLTF